MNRYAFVSGISDGVGKRLALSLPEQGYTVLGVSRTKPDFLRADLPIHWFPMDLAKEIDATRFLEQIHHHTKTLDLVIFNAAAARYGTLTDSDTDDIMSLIHVNFVSLLSLFRLLSPLMTDHGQLIFVTSASVLFPAPGMGVYSAMKAAQEHLAMTLNVELQARHIVCKIVRPGSIRTHFGNKAGYPGAVASGVTPDEVAAHILKACKKGRLVTNVGLDCRIMWVLHKLHHRLCLFISQRRQKR